MDMSDRQINWSENGGDLRESVPAKSTTLFKDNWENYVLNKNILGIACPANPKIRPG